MTPKSSIVYTKFDPIVLAHARALLTSHEAGATEYIEADLRDTGTILSHASELLDLTRPVAVTLISILHAIPDSDDPYSIVGQLMDAVPPGSYLAISHAGSDFYSREALDSIKHIANQKVRQQLEARSREQVARFFDGLDLVEPGLVRVEEWHPDTAASDTSRSSLWCAIGHKS